MKVIADTYKDADNLLRDLVSFEQLAMQMRRELLPYSEISNGRTLPRFIAETSMNLRKLLVKDFAVTYPSIHMLITNGIGGKDSSYDRLSDALYTFDGVQKQVHAANCAIMVDKDRINLTDRLSNVIADLVIWIAIQFELQEASKGENIMMCVRNYCERTCVTAEVFYMLLLQDMQDVGRTWYAYEELSPYCAVLNELDPVFTAECIENQYPISDAMAEQIIEGNLSIPMVRGMMVEHMKDREDVEVDVTPGSLVTRMKLK